jgi:hypothetical protein
MSYKKKSLHLIYEMIPLKYHVIEQSVALLTFVDDWRKVMKKLIVVLMLLSFVLAGGSLAAAFDCPDCPGGICDGTGPHGPNGPKK